MTITLDLCSASFSFVIELAARQSILLPFPQLLIGRRNEWNDGTFSIVANPGSPSRSTPANNGDIYLQLRFSNLGSRARVKYLPRLWLSPSPAAPRFTEVTGMSWTCP
jgi:hypothetical protein